MLITRNASKETECNGRFHQPTIGLNQQSVPDKFCTKDVPVAIQ